MPAMAGHEDVAVGYTQLDDKGRLSISKPVRLALGLHAGSTVAYVKLAHGLMIIPQDEHLAGLMAAAAKVFEDARISVDDVLAELPEARAEVVAEHYGADVLARLERAATDAL
jgi:bifunctional DNA-binding transcriptional regulator/antitoxin component of YhaV-PrlF toxin-antitoxin module